MNFDIFVVGGIDIYKMVFDAIVGIMGSGMVGSVARIFALVGLLMVMFEVAFKGKAQNFLRYAITVALISGVIMVPKATVVIQDRLAPMSPRTVANVPLVVAFAASVTSRVGDRALTIFEQWFATPSAQSYANGGVVFGARLLGDYVQASPPARGQALVLAQFYRDCVIPELGPNGSLTTQEVSSSSDLLQTVTAAGKLNPGRMYIPLTDDGAPLPAVSCTDTTQITRLGTIEANLSTQMLQQVALENTPGLMELNTSSITAELPLATARAQATLGDIASRITRGSATTSAEIGRLIVARNALRDAVLNGGNGMTPGNMVQLTGDYQAESQTASMFAASAHQAQKYIPMLKIVMECLFFALFPLMIPIFFLPGIGGQVLKSYLGGFLYFQLWGPLLVVLNAIFVYWADVQGAGAVWTGGTALGLQVMTLSGLSRHYADIAMIAGNMMMLIPFLAQGILSGAKGVMSQGEAMLAGARQGATSAANAVSTGNYSFGNVTVQQQNDAPMTTTGSARTMQINPDGTGWMVGSNGDRAFQLGAMRVDSAGKGLVNVGFDRAVSESRAREQNASSDLNASISRALNGSTGLSTSLNEFIVNTQDQARGLTRSDSEQSSVSIREGRSVANSDSKSSGFSNSNSNGVEVSQSGSSSDSAQAQIDVRGQGSAGIGDSKGGTGANVAIGSGASRSTGNESRFGVQASTRSDQTASGESRTGTTVTGTSERSEGFEQVSSSVRNMSYEQREALGRRWQEDASQEVRDAGSAVLAYNEARRESESAQAMWSESRREGSTASVDVTAGASNLIRSDFSKSNSEMAAQYGSYENFERALRGGDARAANIFTEAVSQIAQGRPDGFDVPDEAPRQRMLGGEVNPEATFAAGASAALVQGRGGDAMDVAGIGQSSRIEGRARESEAWNEGDTNGLTNFGFRDAVGSKSNNSIVPDDGNSSVPPPPRDGLTRLGTQGEPDGSRSGVWQDAEGNRYNDQGAEIVVVSGSSPNSRFNIFEGEGNASSGLKPVPDTMPKEMKEFVSLSSFGVGPSFSGNLGAGSVAGSDGRASMPGSVNLSPVVDRAVGTANAAEGVAGPYALGTIQQEAQQRNQNNADGAISSMGGHPGEALVGRGKDTYDGVMGRSGRTIDDAKETLFGDGNKK